MTWETVGQIILFFHLFIWKNWGHHKFSSVKSARLTPPFLSDASLADASVLRLTPNLAPANYSDVSKEVSALSCLNGIYGISMKHVCNNHWFLKTKKY